MEKVLNQMLSKYEIDTLEEKENAIKEVLQEIVLCGLSRGGFFNNAAFYGGTALRIFYGLDRFSEDLDFCLTKPNPNFELKKYFKYVEDEVESLGLNFEVVEKDESFDSNIKSAFLKGNTKEHIIKVYADSKNSNLINKEKTIKIKFEVDINPPSGAIYEKRFGLLPSPYEIKLCDLSTLFSGKIHACLCRNWKNRVKGRDFYDYVFFLSNGASVNLINLKEKLVQSNFFDEKDELTINLLREMLIERFSSINFKEAKEDVLPFIKDKSKLDLWDKDFFIDITRNLK